MRREEPGAEELLFVDDIHTYYGESYILQGVTLSVGAGQVVALLGRNGVGKTTTIRSIVGFTPPRRGHVRFQGHEITRRRAYSIARMGLAHVPQGRRIFPSLTVMEHLTTFRSPRVAEVPQTIWNVDRILGVFPRLKERLRLKAGRLSGGEQQMLAISRALIMNPRLLVMDEITEGLSPLLVQEIGAVISEIKRVGGLSILLVEQNLALALDLADCVYIMNKGRVVFQGASQELAQSFETQSIYLGV